MQDHSFSAFVEALNAKFNQRPLSRRSRLICNQRHRLNRVQAAHNLRVISDVEYQSVCTAFRFHG